MVGDVKGSFGFCLLKQGWFHCFARNADLVSLLKKKFYNCSSANAKKWETELQTLKNNNARLTAALQESTTNVEEWKKQLNAYKEENGKLRKKVNRRRCRKKHKASLS